MRPIKEVWIAWGVVVALGIVAAGCSGGSSDTSNGESSTSGNLDSQPCDGTSACGQADDGTAFRCVNGQWTQDSSCGITCDDGACGQAGVTYYRCGSNQWYPDASCDPSSQVVGCSQEGSCGFDQWGNAAYCSNGQWVVNYDCPGNQCAGNGCVDYGVLCANGWYIQDECTCGGNC